MKKPLTICAIPLLCTLVTTTSADERWSYSGNLTLANSYYGGILGIQLGDDGAYLQPSVRVTDTPTGLFGEIWATNGHAFNHEIDLSVGWSGSPLSGHNIQADYSVFYYTIDGTTHDIENLRLFWNHSLQEDWKVYGALQYFLPGDFGPGQGLAYKAGVSYRQFSVEFGGHDGLFDRPAEVGTFGRLVYQTKHIPWLQNAVFTTHGQLSGSPIAPNNVLTGLTWSF